MFGDNFMGFGGFPGDFSNGQAPDRRLPDFGPGGFLPSLDPNPFLKNQCYKSKTGDALDLCKKLNKMGISCDMSIWNEPEPEPLRVDPRDFGSRNQNLGNGASLMSFDGVFSARRSFLHGGSPAELRLLALQESPHQNGPESEPLRVDPRAFGSTNLHGFDQNLGLDGFFSARRSFHQNTSHGGSPADLRLLALQETHDLNGFRDMIPLNNHRDEQMHRPIKRSLMFEGNRVFSKALATIEGPRACSYPEDNLMRRYFMEDEPKFTKSDMPLDLASMISIYGSVDLMARDQIASRFLQKVVEQGTFLDTKVIVCEILGHVIELSMDPFGNYLIQTLLQVCTDEQRTMMVRVLTSRPIDLIKISLNTYGTRVVQRMIETVTTKQQIELVKSGLKPGFLTLVKDLNGNHVLQTCLHSLEPNDHKFVLELATKYCAEIATHRHGCCVLQCCISSSHGAQHERLVAEIARHSLHLSQDPFGNYVVQYLIDQQEPSLNLLYQFRMHYAELATQKFSSHVVEKCLKNYPESRSDIVRELLSVPNFEHLLQDPFANYVIQTALHVTKGRVRDKLVEKVHRCGQLRTSPYCKKIFSKNILKKSP